MCRAWEWYQQQYSYQLLEKSTGGMGSARQRCRWGSSRPERARAQQRCRQHGLHVLGAYSTEVPENRRADTATSLQSTAHPVQQLGLGVLLAPARPVVSWEHGALLELGEGLHRAVASLHFMETSERICWHCAS